MHAPSARGLVNGIGLLVAALVAVSAPAGYFAVGFANTSEALAFKARLNADRVAKYIFAHDRMWKYQHVRLAELIELPTYDGPPVRQRITDAGGAVVVAEAVAVAAPAHRAKAPVVVGGRVVGWLDAETSLRPLLVRTAWVAAFSCSLGLLAWLAVRLFPLRALDRALARLTTESARFGAALDNMTQGLCLFDARHRLVVHNRRFAAMFGAPGPHAAAPALRADPRLGALFHPPGPGVQDGEDGGAHELPDGRVVQVQRRAVPGEGWVATYEDVTERVRARDRLAHMARHDALTGLPNRAAFRERLEDALARARDGGQAVAVLYLDLDGFKGVNDTLGHAAGDELLRAVAQRLRECTRGADLVARLGGDEFTVIQAAAARQPADATALADRIVEALGAPFEIQGQPVQVGTSIGVALADGTEAVAADGLLRSADVALYRAKAAGRGTWRFFEPGMDSELQARRALEADLRRALAEERFEVFYQPLVEARTGALAGFEALIRWRHPERGLVSPAEFIPVAEEIGLIRPVGAWVLHRACADATGWPAHVKVAVNLSAAQFAGGDLVRDVERALAASGLAPERLELEITESVLLQDNDATLAILHRLRGLGPRVSMDDFGTGYSSLSYLRKFPFDKIKIDQCFVRDLALEKGSMEIVRAVVGLGRALGMEVLAEGVETPAQLEALRAEGCDELQGYLFSSPRPLPEVPGIIARHAAPAAERGPAQGSAPAVERV